MQKLCGFTELVFEVEDICRSLAQRKGLDAIKTHIDLMWEDLAWLEDEFHLLLSMTVYDRNIQPVGPDILVAFHESDWSKFVNFITVCRNISHRLSD